MSGHSKWATIKRAKSKTDAERGKIFTKIGKEIAVAVKLGGSDPDANPRLRDMIIKAHASNMPNDNIKRSIQRASGELNSVNYEEVVYEGYGIGGSAVIVACLTDNKNRTVSDVRHIFDKMGGSLGTTGSVSYMFDKKGVLTVEKTNGVKEDDFILMALDAGSEDVIDETDVYQVITEPTEFSEVKTALEKNGVKFLQSDVRFIPQNYIDLSEEHTNNFIKMLNMLEDSDDVQDVYHNVNLPDEEEEE